MCLCGHRNTLFPTRDWHVSPHPRPHQYPHPYPRTCVTLDVDWHMSEALWPRTVGDKAALSMSSGWWQEHNQLWLSSTLTTAGNWEPRTETRQRWGFQPGATQIWGDSVLECLSPRSITAAAVALLRVLSEWRMLPGLSSCPPTMMSLFLVLGPTLAHIAQCQDSSKECTFCTSHHRTWWGPFAALCDCLPTRVLKFMPACTESLTTWLSALANVIAVNCPKHRVM